jgi:hypothetical protein
LKKRSLRAPAVFDALSNKKKISGFIFYCGGVILQIRRKTHVLRKTQNKFLKGQLYRNMLYFVNIFAQTNDEAILFYQKIRREKLYKTCTNNFLLTCSESLCHNQSKKDT